MMQIPLQAQSGTAFPIMVAASRRHHHRRRRHRVTGRKKEPRERARMIYQSAPKRGESKRKKADRER